MSSNVFTLTELMMIDQYYIYKYPINVVSSNVSEISVLLFLQKKKKQSKFKVDIEALKHAPSWGLRHRRDSVSGFSTHSQPMGYAFGTHSPAPTYHSGKNKHTNELL